MLKYIITFLIIILVSNDIIAQNSELVLTIESKFTSLLKNKRFKNNEGRFINEARKEFFSHLKIDNDIKGNLVETFDAEIPSRLYLAIIMYNDMIFIFEKGIKDGEIESGKLTKIDKDDFVNNYPALSCVLFEMEKPVPNKIKGKKREGSYHFRIYLTKILNFKKVFTYIPDDICVNL
ncbi:hypothetical protein [uncultured Tenacibaculum sp.]|uniref:hypothetical protein n=1 Tax=uncultured Tenacibaculum sp. TaxID=174713 RepID=UPI0026158D6A|nr:hypothetical protein [uncultured Tenacibaculum sp.]